MPVRKITAALIGTALAATALAGCTPAPGTSSSFGCTPESAGDGAVLSNISVSGDFAEKPTVTLPKAFTVTAPEREETIVGEGKEITSLSQAVAVELTLLNSTDGSVLSQTEYAGAPGYAPLGSAVQAITTFGQSLMCAREGSRVVSAFPSSALDPATAQGVGLTGVTGIIAVVDVVGVMEAAATGESVFNAAWGMPSVVRAPSGQPGLVFPSGAAPKKTTVQTIIKGSGDTLSADTRAVINVLGVSWAPDAATGQRSPFVDTWTSNQPIAISAGDAAALPAGFADALKGATIGSQLLIVVPAAENTVASQAIADNTGEDVVYVIDIVGAL